MTNLCLIACHKIIFSTQLQFDILFNKEDGILRDFPLFLPKKVF